MAGTRVPRSGRTPRSREMGDARAQKILNETKSEFGGDGYVRGVKPQTARDIAGIAGRMVADLDESKSLKKRTTSLLQRWALRSAPEQADQFWANPAHMGKFGFYVSLHPLTSAILAHQSVVDLLGKRPDEFLGHEFSPKRQAMVRYASAALVDAADSIQLVHAYEQPVPGGLEVATQSSLMWMEDTAVPFPDRLASYDSATLREYEASLTQRQYVKG